MPDFRKATGMCTLVGMQTHELTTVALTAALLPPPRCLPRAQATTSPRVA
jgi:hypothetical protein